MTCISTNEDDGTPKFTLGQIVGTVDQDGKAANDESLIDGGRILSAYKTTKGVKLWIITEAADDDGNRAVTTLLLPSEY